MGCSRFAYNRKWHGKLYRYKRIEAFTVKDAPDDWLVITVVAKFFS
ncbi:MAG: hypothetical protein H0U59_03325 [Gemmatimonadaceae bacterium]|nr:hypothetical protein [Gemmatimonadaceae bacterium]